MTQKEVIKWTLHLKTIEERCWDLVEKLCKNAGAALMKKGTKT